MVEVEITAIAPLTPDQRTLVDHHALLNVYNVLRAELTFFGHEVAGQEQLLTNALTACDHRIGRLSDRAAALHDAAHDQEFEHTIHRERDFRLAQHPTACARPGVVTSMENLDAFLWLLRVRGRELLARAETATDGWSHVAADELLADFQEWLHSLERFARGRFRFVYNLAQQGPRDYYVDLRFDGGRGGLLSFPPVLKDVLRDLIANARKYTAPGGQIRAALYSAPDGITLVVEDNGRGIPADELNAVIECGRRGRNTADVATLGAGLGLTKAFFVTREHGGRFWIASEEGRGTRVRLTLPPPHHVREIPGIPAL